MDKESENTEEKILEAAKKIFIRKGLAASRMQEIADEAGINKALLHYYFRSKDKLYDAVVKSVMKNFFPRLFGVIDSVHPVMKKMELLVDNYLNLNLQNPYLSSFIISEINQDPTRIFSLFEQTSLSANLDKLQLQIDSEAEAGIIRKVDVRQLVISVVSMCIFPFAAKPLLVRLFGVDELKFNHFIEERRKFIPELINLSLKIR